VEEENPERARTQKCIIVAWPSLSNIGYQRRVGEARKETIALASGIVAHMSHRIAPRNSQESVVAQSRLQY